MTSFVEVTPTYDAERSRTWRYANGTSNRLSLARPPAASRPSGVAEENAGPVDHRVPSDTAQPRRTRHRLCAAFSDASQGRAEDCRQVGAHRRPGRRVLLTSGEGDLSHHPRATLSPVTVHLLQS